MVWEINFVCSILNHIRSGCTLSGIQQKRHFTLPDPFPSTLQISGSCLRSGIKRNSVTVKRYAAMKYANTRCQLAGLLNLMVASGTGIRESCGLRAPLLLFGESIN
ncbi:hypothetical protein CEXT_613721 [Caerostris extrusa]|uniref:Uncharacterized protein n=1 Tax=Caerostris extrusa TaxID=172846 RepID=A0AAV4XZD7_CAEEX|nr:hypothetical protein CEXT_613721 [Caerostris extrusa]